MNADLPIRSLQNGPAEIPEPLPASIRSLPSPSSCSFPSSIPRQIKLNQAKSSLLTLCALLTAVAAAPAADDKKEDSPAKAARAVPRLLVPPVSTSSTRVTWRNGEELRGELVGAGGGFLSWKSSFFQEPVKITQDVLRRIDFTIGFQRSDGNFRLALADGSHFTGDFDSLDAETISFNSSSCGKIKVNKGMVVAVERINGEGVIAAGPLAILPDKAVIKNNETGASATPLFLAAAGRAASPGFNLSTVRTLDLPDKSLSEFLIRTETVPDFKFTVATLKESATVETWGDELVLVQGDRFVSAGKKFKDTDRTAHIRVGWDRPGQRVALYGSDGSLWAEIGPDTKLEPPKKEEPKKEDPAAKKETNWMRRVFGGEEPPTSSSSSSSSRSTRASKGVTLLNKGSGILIERFSATDWNGKPPPPAVIDAPAVETTDEFVAGEPIAIEGDSLQVKNPAGETRPVPLAKVRAIRWPRPVKSDRDSTVTDLWFSDGNLLRGKLTEVTEGKATLETAFTATPVTTALARARALILAEPDKKEDPVPLAKLDILRVGEYVLHGTIEPNGGSLPDFRPVGAQAALAPVAAADLTMTRVSPADEKFERSPALLHVKTSETLPVTLQNVTRDKVEFAWDAAENHSLEIAQLHAIQFNTPAPDGKGFDGAGWRSLNEDGKGISRKGDGVILQPGAGIAHPWLLQGGDINFRMAPDDGRGIATIRIRLFCQGTVRDNNSVNLILGDFGGELYCGLERGEGQMSGQTQVTTDGQPANIRISFPGDKVQLWVNKVKVVDTTVADAAAIANGIARARIVNGQIVQAAPANKNAKPRTGTGMIIETAALWGNQQGSVKLMDLSMDSSPCMAGPPAFTEDAKREALILPRLRREDPPRQILIGRNGDLLRGEIEGITSTHLAFRAGLENFKVPVDRVAAAVWLIAPPKPTPPKEEEESPAPEPKKKKKDNPDEILAPHASLSPFVANPIIPDPDKDGKKEESKVATQWLDLNNGGRIGLKVESWNKDFVTGQHPLLGKCRIPRTLIHHFTLKQPSPPAALTALSNWKLTPTADPVIPEDSGDSSPLAGKDAPSFKLPMLEGDDFSLADAKGKVIVLDFWATWCGPCIKSLPGLIDTMGTFHTDDVAFIAVNQGETKDQVKKFLAARQWKMPVGFDADQKVGGKFGVSGIPHTVVIDRAGKIAFTKTGYEADGDKKIAEAVKKALEAPAPPKDADKPDEKPKEKGKEKQPPKRNPNDPLLPEPDDI